MGYDLCKFFMFYYCKSLHPMLFISFTGINKKTLTVMTLHFVY